MQQRVYAVSTTISSSLYGGGGGDGFQQMARDTRFGCNTSSPSVKGRIPRHRHPSEDPRVGVGVGVVECGLN